MYARRRRRTGRVVGVLQLTAGVAALIGVGATLIPSWLRSGPSMGHSEASPKGSCVPDGSSRGTTRLGALAWVRDGVLSVLELDSCKERTPRADGRRPPVRFSHDGRWIAFGGGTIVRAAGGGSKAPSAGRAPGNGPRTANDLAGVTSGGGVAVGGCRRG
jgi:hypothetical protein